ncbi:uncharacterized protein B0H18DRAFT_1118922 [Fomitopsis serialis]|uniref:uncharacterized protein n=1 Tax=Fomitopsis serialis TaxID=139415 RepID=UPI00200753B0|nr:uncharacterized protein B0H18DRAFT_1118922 [Neoantrodia serialis]KAH9926422.1 hypothetical protein B0H18DRAFT_1118922 [Neoantrodia serialis]
MPALTNNNSATRTKLRGVGPAHVTPVSALKAQRNGEQPPAPGGPETDTSSPAVLKAVREFEHGRQRTRRAADTERMRERKERKRRGGAAPRAVRPTHSGHARKVDVTGAEDVEERDGDGESYPLAASQAELGEDPAGTADLDVSASQQISLEAFIKPAKLHKRKAEDFEVVPKVRSVIALDDHAPPLPEVDEPWEHVTLEDEHDLAPSYAQVVATAA